ncbi:hypothetical protein [Clostridium beijerinckii]|nr:hypothetical protein [Clostridium beijerinckii]
MLENKGWKIMINDYLEIRNAEVMPKLVDANMSLGFLLYDRKKE